MDNNKDIVHFTLNNWMVGKDYPPGEPFNTWMRFYTLTSDIWCKEQKICVYYGNIDMSINYCVTATREWVAKNCPLLLSNDTYIYKETVYKGGLKETTEKIGKFSDFVVYEDDNEEEVNNKYDWSFLEYKEENFGAFYYKDPVWSDDEEEEDIEDE